MSAVALLCCLLAPALGCVNRASATAVPEWSESRSLHGVEVRITVRDPDRLRARAAVEEAMTAAAEAAGLLLVEWPGSEIDILQRAPSRLWIEVSPTTGEALVLASRIAEDTDGAFDPTYPPLQRLWGLRDERAPKVPRAFEIDMALRRVDWTDIELDFDGAHQVRRATRRTEVDLGGLARGAMLDAAVERLRAMQVPAGRASTQRQHAVYGGSPGRPWPVEVLVRSPHADGRDASVGKVSLVEGGLAVASRGAVLASADGTAIHDRFDPRSGQPASATRWLALEADRASTAAGYADAVFAMGADGPHFVAARESLAAVIAFDRRETFVSSSMAFDGSEVQLERPEELAP